MGYASFYYFIKEKANRRLFLLIIFLILLLSIIFSIVKKRPVPPVHEALYPTPTIIIPTWSEKEDFVEEEFKTKPKKAYEYTLSNGQTVTIYVPEDANPPPLSVVEEMYRSKQ